MRLHKIQTMMLFQKYQTKPISKKLNTSTKRNSYTKHRLNIIMEHHTNWNW